MRTTALLVVLLATGLVPAEDKPATPAKPETPAAAPARPEAPAEAKAAPEASAEAKATPESGAGGPTAGEEAKPEAPATPKGASPADPKFIDGMSILGNQEAPKSLVIVPWKSSELGGSLGIAPLLDDSRQPVDRDVFLRALRYYEIRSEKRP